MNINLKRHEVTKIIRSLTGRRNTLRREANYDGVTKFRKARMRLESNEIELIITKLVR